MAGFFFENPLRITAYLWQPFVICRIGYAFHIIVQIITLGDPQQIAGLAIRALIRQSIAPSDPHPISSERHFSDLKHRLRLNDPPGLGLPPFQERPHHRPRE
jgi:hypothetical protein